MNIEEVASRLWSEGTDHGWWRSAYTTLSDCQQNDPIGYSEFMGLIERITAAPASDAEPVAWLYEWKPNSNNNPWQTEVALRDPRINPVREIRNVRRLTFTIDT